MESSIYQPLRGQMSMFSEGSTGGWVMIRTRVISVMLLTRLLIEKAFPAQTGTSETVKKQ